VRVVYSARYQLDLHGHIWPTEKYRPTYAALLERHLITPHHVVEPIAVSWDHLRLAHASEYLHKIRTGSLSAEEIAQLELPFSADLVEGFRLMTGGTVIAARHAFESTHDGGQSVVIHLGGGFHHAFANHGEGFCLFNDVAVAIRVLQHELGVVRAAVVDLDVHHGNGTAMIFGRDPAVFTFSMHQQHNYPDFKPKSSLDIGLSDGADDDEYLRRLREALPTVFASDPQVVFYLAGADPFRGDQLGGLGLTQDGLRRRDRDVFEAARDAKVPVAVVLAGGYAQQIADTVGIHVATVEEALRATRQA
jgi:acetoin utilization deacetylase AcuC-like enzyme